MKPFKNIWITLLLLILAAAQVHGEDRRQIKIATEGAYPPWNFLNASGRLAGFEIDLANDLCGRMQADCTLIPKKWRGIIKGLEEGQYDAIMAAMSITESRQKRIRFSRSYADTPNVFVVRKDNPIADFPSDLHQLTLNEISPAEKTAIDKLVAVFKGKVIGVQVSTINQQFAEMYLSESSEIRIYDYQHTVDLELYQGRLDALIGGMAYWVPLLKSKQGRNYRMVGPRMTGGPFGNGIGVGVRKDDKEMSDMFSRAIENAIKDGSLEKLAIKWFSFDVSVHE